MNIFEIDNKIQQLFDEAIEIDNNDIDNEAEKQRIINEYEKLKIDRIEKIDNTISFYKFIQTKIEALKAHKRQIDDRIRSDEKMLAKIENLIKYATKEEKFETLNHKISYRKSEQLNIINEDLIPRSYFDEKIEYKVDKNKVKQAIKEGILTSSICGAIIEQKNNIQIK